MEDRCEPDCCRQRAVHCPALGVDRCRVAGGVDADGDDRFSELAEELLGEPNRHRQPAPLVGIGDNNLAMFSDPRFLALGIKNVRFDMAWDVLSRAYRSPYRRDVLQAWLEDARTDGLTPVIVFDHSERKASLDGCRPWPSSVGRSFGFASSTHGH